MHNSKVSNSKKIKFTNFSVFEEDFCVRAEGLFFQTYFFFSDSGFNEQLSKKYTFFDEKKISYLR